jgi:hypothetical protein
MPRQDVTRTIVSFELEIEYVASLTATDEHFPAIEAAIAPRGRLAVIDDPTALDLVASNGKASRFTGR